MVLIAIGLAPNNGRAILQAFSSRREHPFVRTPKQGNRPQSPLLELNFDWIMLVELGLALYAWVGVGLAIRLQNYGPLFFLSLCALAYSTMAALNMREWRWHIQQEQRETAVSSLQ